MDLERCCGGSRTAKKTNEWVLNKASVEGTVRHRKSKETSIYCNHTMRKQRSCLEKEIMQGRGVVLKRSGGRLKQDLDEDLKTL